MFIVDRPERDYLHWKDGCDHKTTKGINCRFASTNIKNKAFFTK